MLADRIVPPQLPLIDQHGDAGSGEGLCARRDGKHRIGSDRRIAPQLPLAVVLFANLLLSSLASSQDPFAGFDKYVGEAMEKWRVPGLAIAVVKDGKLCSFATSVRGWLLMLRSIASSHVNLGQSLMRDQGELLLRPKAGTVRHMPLKLCPKCNSEMQPGFPVEVASKGGQYVTRWSNELPSEISGLFGGTSFTTQAIPTKFLMGFACGQCGFVELYKVSEQQLRQFLHDVAAQQLAAADRESSTPPRL